MMKKFGKNYLEIMMKKNKQLEELKENIAKGLKEAYKKMIIFKKYKNSPIILSRNGEVVEVNANDVSFNKHL